MRKTKLMFIGVFLLLCVTACHSEEEQSVSLETVEAEDVEKTAEAGGSIFVYVCGAVEEEGVYELPVGSRAYEAVEMAGGFRGDAATTAVNQAEVLEDEAHLYVPTISEVATGQSEDDGKININKATKAELMTLPGVGESRADSIIKYREDVGAFETIEDIMKISGIKEGLFAKIKDLIKI